jgi:ribosomal protein L20A (L18A)
MKTYEVELQRTSYITITVEAENEDDAEDKAWREIEGGRTDINDAEWDIRSIEEVFS